MNIGLVLCSKGPKCFFGMKILDIRIQDKFKIQTNLCLVFERSFSILFLLRFLNVPIA
jgi:hypothetical protein